MTPPDFARWIAIADEYDIDALCVTAATVSTIDAKRIFRVAPDAVKVDLDTWLNDNAEHGSFGDFEETDCGTVVFENNGWAGSTIGILGAMSQAGRAASVYWNVNGNNRLMLSEDGVLLSEIEPAYFEVPESDEEWARLGGTDPKTLSRYLQGLLFEEDWAAASLTVIERFTGIAVPQRVWTQYGGEPPNDRMLLIPNPTDEDYHGPGRVKDESCTSCSAEIELPTSPEADSQQATSQKADSWEAAEVENTATPTVLHGQGTVWVWGESRNALLGDNQTTTAWLPLKVVGLDGVIAVFPGPFAITADNSTWAWGDNEYGRLGIGAHQLTRLPKKVNLPHRPVSVVNGYSAAYACLADGSLWAWGKAWSGTHPDGVTKKTATPIEIAGLADVRSLWGESDTFYAITSSGSVWAWGSGTNGALGDGVDQKYPASLPRTILHLPPIRAIDARRSAIAALTSTGDVYVWGGAYFPEITCVTGLSGVANISGGCALKTDGTVWVWRRLGIGLNEHEHEDLTTAEADQATLPWYGFSAGSSLNPATHRPSRGHQATDHFYSYLDLNSDGSPALSRPHDEEDESWLWDPRSAVEAEPAEDWQPRVDGTNRHDYGYAKNLRAFQVPGIDNVIQISSNGTRPYALKTDGTVWTWGPADDTATESQLPTRVLGLENIVKLAEKGEPVAIASDGSVWVWAHRPRGDIVRRRDIAERGDIVKRDENGSHWHRPPRPPTKVAGLTGVSTVVNAGSVTFALVP